jgi:hypothetical protein
VRHPNNKDKQHQGVQQNHPQRTVSPNPTLFGGKPKKTEPENLRREISTPSQRNWAEGTILFGEDDALPLRIAQAVSESPSTSSCINTIAQFIKGSGFAEKELMDMPIDQEGKTLWDFHCALADSLALFWGFSVNFKFDKAGRIINTYQLSFESCRFKEPGEKSPYITEIAFNPYFGTLENKKEYTKVYPVFNADKVTSQIADLDKDERNSWPGQIYYYGKTSPLSRFYPKPKYWSAKEAIEADHKLQEFVNEELENGFFQSVIINMIGDPNQPSSNPKYQKEETKSDGTTKYTKSTHTVGQEFNEEMGETFAGSKKAGTALVLWSKNKESSPNVTEFPSTFTSDQLNATRDSIIKIITIATEVPSILANISEGVSLGSGGSEMQKAIELMQSRTAEFRVVLENFYNKVMFPNMQKRPKGEVKIVNFNPITVPIEINKDVWAFLNEQEKISFIKKNMPDIEIIRTPAPVVAEPVTTEGGAGEVGAAPVVAPPKPNEALKDLGIEQINKIQKIVARYNLSLREPDNSKALTFEQAKQFLLSYGLTENELNAWLVTPEEI